MKPSGSIMNRKSGHTQKMQLQLQIQIIPEHWDEIKDSCLLYGFRNFRSRRH